MLSDYRIQEIQIRSLRSLMLISKASLTIKVYKRSLRKPIFSFLTQFYLLPHLVYYFLILNICFFWQKYYRNALWGKIANVSMQLDFNRMSQANTL